MKTKSSFIVAASLITALLLAVTAGCSDPTGGKATGSNETPVKDVTAVKILRDGKEVKTAINAYPGDKVEFTAKVTVKGGADDSVTWEVDGKTKSGTKINGNGVLTINANEPVGTLLTVTATSTVKESVFREVTVKVVAAGSRTELVISWPDALEAPSVASGDTLQLYVADENGDMPYVLWEIVSEFYSEGTFIDPDTGELYIGEDETADSLLIRVTSMEDEDLYNEEEITIIKNDPPEQPGDGDEDTDTDTDTDGDDDKPILPLGTLTIKPAAASVSQGQTLQFTVEPSNPDLLPVTWAITSNGNSAGTNINNTGLLTVAPNETLTALTIKATSVGNSTVSATQTVTITPVTPLPPGEFAITYGPFTGGGSITGPASAAQGTFVQLAIVPNGYIFISLTVTRTGTETEVGASGSGNNRTFIMPGADVSVAAVFTTPETATYLSEDFNPVLCSFYDKFDGTGTDVNANGLDRDRWGFDNGGGGFGNGEAQYYDGDNNAIVRDGMLSLVLEKKRTGSNNYTSAKVWTSRGTKEGLEAGKPFSQQYGRFEARIRMVSHGTASNWNAANWQGFWPAFWMMPATSAYGIWPRSGEIDIMEMKGRIGNQASSTIHAMNRDGNAAGGSMYRGTDHGFDEGDITTWHVYSIIWSPTGMKMLIDGKMFREILFSSLNLTWYNATSPQQGPFNKPFYLIINFAVGGQFDQWRLPEDVALPASLDIDWVRCYTLENDPWGTPQSFTGTKRDFAAW